MVDKVALITCITNAGGVGPGHTAVLLGDTVYSFENMGDWFSVFNEKSGWKIFKLKKYLETNKNRPVIIQELSSKVSAAKVKSYILNSISSDADYGSSGVCSSVAASAVEGAMTGSFNPSGVDTPYKVFHLAIKKGIVKSTQVYWPGKSSLSDGVRQSILNKIKADYPSIGSAVGLPSRQSADGIAPVHGGTHVR